MKRLKKAGRFLYSMKFAVFLLIILVAACIAGSVIPQGEQASWYTSHYSRQAAGAVMLFGLDDIFHSWWFALLTAVLCLNLLLCSVLRFPSLIGRMKNGFTPVKSISTWNQEPVIETPDEPDELFERLGFRKIHRGKVALTRVAEPPKTQEFACLYSAKNKIGIWGAWLCHLGMLIIILGFVLGQVLKSEYTVYGVPGQTKPVGNTDYELTIDAFDVAMRDDYTVDQYTSKLTVTDRAGERSLSGTASVNAPLSLFGMKFYQNSTGWAASVDVWRDGEKIQEALLCAGEHMLVEDQEGLAVVFNAFYPDLYEDENGQPITLTPVLKNPGYLYSLYYHDQMIGMNVLESDEKITVEDYEIVFHDPQQYTLIQVKRDPYGIVAAIGGLVMLLSLILAFYVQPRELWALKGENGRWMVAGASRKAGVMFEEEIRRSWLEIGKGEKKNGK